MQTHSAIKNKFTDNSRYFLYIVRECTGPVIAAAMIYFVALLLIDPTMSTLHAGISPFIWGIGLAASLIHSLTWFKVTTKITPITLAPWQQWVLFLLFISAAGIISYLAFTYAYIA